MKRFIYFGLLILAINGIILGKVIYNRHSEIVTLELTERELTIPYRFSIDRESTQAKLNLKWRTINQLDDDAAYYYWGDRQLNLPKEKIKSLGFDIKSKNRRFYENPSKELYWLVEFDGKHYNNYLNLLNQQLVQLKQSEPNKETLSQQELEKKVERLQEKIQEETLNKSRLIVVDVSDRNDFGKSGHQLNEGNYLVVKGLARVYFDYSDVKDNEEPKVALYLQRMLVSQIHLPKEKVTSFPLKRDYGKKYQYKISIGWGKLLEPWVKHVEFLE